MSVTQNQAHDTDAEEDQVNKVMVREQAENLVQASYQSLQTLNVEQEEEYSMSNEATDQDDSDFHRHMERQIQVWKPEQDDTSKWLFDLVFLPYAETIAISDSNLTNTAIPSKLPERSAQSVDTSADVYNNSMVALATSFPQHMQLLSKASVSSSSVVDELLADYTTLTEAEIRGIAVENTDANSSQELKGVRETAIRFKDVVGRKYFFPWDLARTWRGMEELIKQAFLHIEVIGPRVQDGHYDLIGPYGDYILPCMWDKMIEPGSEVSMLMWPMGKNRPLLAHPRKSGQPDQSPNVQSTDTSGSKVKSSQASSAGVSRIETDRIDGGMKHHVPKAGQDKLGGRGGRHASPST